MKTTVSLFLLITVVLYTPYLFSQSQESEKAEFYGIMQVPTLVPSLAQQMKEGTFVGVDPNEQIKVVDQKRRGANITVPGKGLPKTVDELVQNQMNVVKHEARDPKLVFNASTTNSIPSDPTGAIGSNHFIGAWNRGFRIFDKQGNPLTEEASLSTIFPGNTNYDPIVLYDVEADRFVITLANVSPNGFSIAVCQGSDPVNDGWYIYTTGFDIDQVPDYQKYSVWSDGYYVTANIVGSNKVFVMERTEMLQGHAAQFVEFPLPGISISGFYSPQFFNVTNGDMPPPGNATIVYMQDDAWPGISTDHLKLWSVNVNWTDISNSTISAPAETNTTPFISVFDGGSFSNVPQPNGPDQDVLQATIMNQAQYRRFPDYNSAIFNFVVDTDGSESELAGIRWFELRQENDGDPWTIYQEGTYISPYNNKHAFSGSMAMDGHGNIGMGYTTVSSSERIAINFTGRYASDPLGQMTVDETLIAQSLSDNPYKQLADYVQLSLDPFNDKTFWHIAEYFINDQRTDVVGVFQITSDFVNDVGVISVDEPIDGALSDEEIISITVFNYGLDEQTNIPVSYQVNGGTVITEILPGPISSAMEMQYTFSTTADMGTVGSVYQITAFTDLLDDEDHLNDTTMTSVSHLYPDDIGVAEILSPVSGSGLSAEEDITVVINNFGTNDQSNFDVSYQLNDELVTENVPGPLTVDSPLSYTFTQTGNLLTLDTYELKSYTSLPLDANLNNDTTTIMVVNSFCEPESNCNSGSGLFLVKLGSIDNTSDCSPQGYGDYTEFSTELENNSTNDLIIATYYGSQYVKAWIDFNDNFVFETEEVVVDNYVIAPGQLNGYYVDTPSLTIPDGVNLGEHLLRVKANRETLVPQSACEGTIYGETEDYTVDLVLHLGVHDLPLCDAEMVIKTLGNKHFEVSLESSDVNETLIINLHNISGQKLVENRVAKIDGRYVYHMDLSYAKPGAYIVRLGSAKYGKVKRIVVK